MLSKNDHFSNGKHLILTFLYPISQFILRKKATIHQVTTMLATSKNVLFPGHSHLLTTGADDPFDYHLRSR